MQAHCSEIESCNQTRKAKQKCQVSEASWTGTFNFTVMSGNTRLASMSLTMWGSICNCFKLSLLFLKRWANTCVFSHAVLNMAMLFGDVLFLNCPYRWSSVVADLGPRTPAGFRSLWQCWSSLYMLFLTLSHLEQGWQSVTKWTISSLKLYLLLVWRLDIDFLES